MTTKQKLDRLSVIVPIVNNIKHIQAVQHIVADYQLEINYLKSEIKKSIRFNKFFKSTVI